MSITAPPEAKAWTAGFESISGETPEEVELSVEGSLPPEVAGTLYRIGPAGFGRAGERDRHWFDGDGMVHAVRLGPDGVRYRSRWVATTGKRAEDAAGRRLFGGGFATPPPGGPLHRLRHARPKNVANINVIAHAGKLYALWEGGRPHRLDPQTLETLGEDDLGGLLGPNDGFSAHPKSDPDTGEIWNFGVTYGPRTWLSIYRAGPEGHWSRQARLSLAHPYMVHDMALTPASIVMVLAPVALPWIPVGLLTGNRGYGDSLRYRPRWGASILVIDRATGKATEHKTAPFMVFHLAGARQEGGALEMELCTYPDASVIGELGRVMDGRAPHLRPRLERITIDRAGKVSRRAIADLPFEFPRPAGPAHVAGVTISEDAEFLNAPAMVDTRDGGATIAPTQPWEFAGEVVPVAERWGLTFVLDGRDRASELRILDLADLPSGPVATIRLPRLVPFGLHGNFVPSGER